MEIKIQIAEFAEAVTFTGDGQIAYDNTGCAVIDESLLKHVQGYTGFINHGPVNGVDPDPAIGTGEDTETGEVIPESETGPEPPVTEQALLPSVVLGEPEEDTAEAEPVVEIEEVPNVKVTPKSGKKG